MGQKTEAIQLSQKWHLINQHLFYTFKNVLPNLFSMINYINLKLAFDILIEAWSILIRNHAGFRVPVNPMTGVPIRRGENTERHRKAKWRQRQRLELCHHQSRSTGATRYCKRQGSALLKSPQRQQDPTYTRLPASRLWENKFLLFWATQIVVICYGTYRKLIQSFNALAIRQENP